MQTSHKTYTFRALIIYVILYQHKLARACVCLFSIAAVGIPIVISDTRQNENGTTWFAVGLYVDISIFPRLLIELIIIIIVLTILCSFFVFFFDFLPI